jgi:hypothetical protein
MFTSVLEVSFAVRGELAPFDAAVYVVGIAAQDVQFCGVEESTELGAVG